MRKEDHSLVEFSYKEKNKYEFQPEIDQQQESGLFEDELHTELWIKINQKQREGISWNRAMDEVRVEKLIQKYKDDGELDSEDPALMMLKQWPNSERYKNSPEKLPGLERLINRLLDILLDSELNYENKYQRFRDKEDKTKKTLMHYAAELGFLDVTKTLAKKCPWLLTVATKAPLKKRGLIPVEIALEAENDEVTAYLIRLMYHERAQSLFSWRPDQDITNPQPSFYTFKSIIENPKMKKTVVAVLDQMVNPHWPHLPKRKETYSNEEEREGVEGAWNSITDDPLDYQFYYHILDGDEGGRPPKIETSAEKKERDNPHFNWRNKSCLEVIAKSKNKEALQHPVVRMLVKTKWNSYGHLFLSLQAALYVIFLLFLSYSLLYASTKLDPTQYRGTADLLRGICEVFTLLMVLFYMCEEINQMRLNGYSYFIEWITLFDWLGLVLILCVIPLRYIGSKSQWLVASSAFLFNFLRILKFSCLTRTTGLYTKTLAKIIQQDLARFLAVFSVIFFPFCSALFLSLRSSRQIPDNKEFSGFQSVLLRGFRALSEQRPIAEDYSTFNWLSILLMLAYMGTVIVILLNILIAQMSTTYIQAKKVARLEYDVDRILQLTRMERFPFLNLRVKYYKKGGWISEKKLAEELLEFSEDRSPWESVEDKLYAIRDKMRKMIKQMRQQRE
ncbi:transient receptor potential cation channel subfamily A member 1-like [Pocillopora verrucosa]|uniref:transient receptor potential cation channel subfamily A member 1-like n=1 Tax=Pocillopora verrucosa TaxID=203993 RepID=UPI0033408897